MTIIEERRTVTGRWKGAQFCGAQLENHEKPTNTAGSPDTDKSAEPAHSVGVGIDPRSQGDEADGLVRTAMDYVRELIRVNERDHF